MWCSQKGPGPLAEQRTLHDHIGLNKQKEPVCISVHSGVLVVFDNWPCAIGNRNIYINFCGMNTPSMINLKHPTWSYQVRNQEETLSLALWKKLTLGPAHHGTDSNFLTMNYPMPEGVSVHPNKKSPIFKPNKLTLGFFFYFKIKAS